MSSGIHDGARPSENDFPPSANSGAASVASNVMRSYNPYYMLITRFTSARARGAA